MELNNLDNMQDNNIAEAVKKYNTPLYIYDAEVIQQNYQQLRNCFGDDVDIFYSIKANPNISICNLLKKYGAGAEVCSLAELETAIKAGFNPDNIIYVGPYKSKQAIVRCLELAIHAIVCESVDEYYAICHYAKKYSHTANILLRVNPNFIAKNALLKMGGKASQFGIDQEFIMQNGEMFFANENVRVIGIHVYNGTRILDSTTIYNNTKNILKLAEQLMLQWQQRFSVVDIGGGIGVPYFEEETEINFSKLRECMQPLITAFKRQFPETKLILETGRFVVAEAGKFVTSIKVIKKSRNQIFLITDGGTNCHMAAVGTSTLFHRNFPITIISNKTAIVTEKYNIVGPLCTPNDVIGSEASLPVVKVGDLIVVNFSGAYGPSASPVYFLSHGYPAEVLIHKGKAHLIRERDSIDDLLKKQRLVE